MLIDNGFRSIIVLKAPVVDFRKLSRNGLNIILQLFTKRHILSTIKGFHRKISSLLSHD
jgi:hypothetical protein